MSKLRSFWLFDLFAQTSDLKKIIEHLLNILFSIGFIGANLAP